MARDFNVYIGKHTYDMYNMLNVYVYARVRGLVILYEPYFSTKMNSPIHISSLVSD